MHPSAQSVEIITGYSGSWLSGSPLVSINKVTVCRTRLVLGWVTVFGWQGANHLSHPGQLSLATPLWIGKSVPAKAGV